MLCFFHLKNECYFSIKNNYKKLQYVKIIWDFAISLQLIAKDNITSMAMYFGKKIVTKR